MKLYGHTHHLEIPILRSLHRLLPLIALALGSTRVSAQRDSADSQQIEAAIVARLKTAVAANDRAAIARLFVYPTRVSRSATSHFLIRSSAELLAQFDSVIPPSIRQAVLAQRTDSLSYSWRGTMIGDGEVWVGGVCFERPTRRCNYGVTTINLPSPSRH